MGTPNKYRPEMCQKAIEVLSGGESIVAVAAELGVSRVTVYEWKDTHPEFNAAINIGLAHGQRKWEAIGKQGITGGYERFSATAWMFTMKNRFREDYREEKEAKSVSDTIVDKLIDRLIE